MKEKPDPKAEAWAKRLSLIKQAQARLMHAVAQAAAAEKAKTKPAPKKPAPKRK